MSYKLVSIFGSAPDYPPGVGQDESLKWLGRMTQGEQDGMFRAGFLSEQFINAIYGPEQITEGILTITANDILFKTSIEGLNKLVDKGILSEDFREAFVEANKAVDEMDMNRTWRTKLREAWREHNQWNYPHTYKRVVVNGFKGVVALSVTRHGLD